MQHRTFGEIQEVEYDVHLVYLLDYLLVYFEIDTESIQRRSDGVGVVEVQPVIGSW